MANVNTVILAGNMTRDVEIKYLADGKAVGTFGLAINERGGDGKRDRTVFVDVTVWEKQAENCGQYLSTGSGVLIEGKLGFDSWEKDGQKRSKLYVTAYRVQFLDPKPRRDEEGRVEGEVEFPPKESGATGATQAGIDRAVADGDGLPF